MFKKLSKEFHLHLPTLYMTLGMIWSMALFGLILFEFLMQLIVIKKPDPEVFQMAFLMAFMTYIGATLFAGGISSYTSFNISVSMGCTRKSFIIMRTIFLFITNLIGLLSVVAIYALENLYLELHWKGIPLEEDLGFLLNPLVLFVLWVVGTILPFFVSALTLRFGKTVSIIMYAVWLIACLSFTHAEDFIHSDSALKVVRFLQMLQPYQWGIILLIVCAVLYMIAYRLYRKQAVVA